MHMFLNAVLCFLLPLVCRAEGWPAVPSRVRVRVEGRGCAPVPLPSLADGEGHPLNVQIGDLLTPNPCNLRHFRLEGSGDWSRAACGLGGPLAAGGAGANLLLRSSCSRPAIVIVEVGIFSGRSPLDPHTNSNTHLAAAVLSKGRELRQGPGESASSAQGPTNGTQGDCTGGSDGGSNPAGRGMYGAGASSQALSAAAPPPSPAPPPPSPPPLTFNNMVCCCKNTSAIIEYVSPSPANCCCGLYRQCCIRDSMVTGLCHGSSMCSVVMVTGVVFFAGIICCIGAVVLWRQRAMARERRAARAASAEQGPSLEGTTPPAETSEAELEGKRVMPPTTEQMGADLECPVCLETLTVSPDNWVNFPCQHGSCMACLQGMIKHNRRRRSHRHLLPCPLCRHLAVGRLSTPITAEGMAPADSALSEAAFATAPPTAHNAPPTLPSGAEDSATEEGNGSSGPGAVNPTVAGATNAAGEHVRETELAARPSQI